METKQKLGPLQREWIRCLRSGAFPQGESYLIGSDEHVTKPGDVYPHCCLGVACRVAEANGMKLRYVVEKECEGRVLRIAEPKNEGGEGDDSTQVLPWAVCVNMKFYGTNGELKSPTHDCMHEGFQIGGAENTRCLTDANDGGATFAEIADFAEAHPEEVFSGPA